MNRRNLISAVIIFCMSIVSVVFGYWVGYEERKEIALSHIDLLGMVQNKEFVDAKRDLEILQLLKEGKNDMVYERIELNVKSALKYIELDEAFEKELFPLVKPSKELLDQAAGYQAKYCPDKCLGI